jgi:hypothetical protein
MKYEDKKMKYYVYENDAINKAIIHKKGCSFIKLHGGKHSYKQGQWTEWNTLNEAISYTKSLNKKTKRGCKFCLPNITRQFIKQGNLNT